MADGTLTLIGRGRTADIFAWKENQALKLFQPWCSQGMIEKELRIARIVQNAGLPVPAIEDGIVEVDGRRGIVYERLYGPSMLALLRSRPWLVGRYGRLQAELHAAIHNIELPQLPQWRSYLERAIAESAKIPEQMKQATLKRLADLPDAHRLCHGDFHPDNIIMTKTGPCVIDWTTATQCHPLADVARSSLLMRIGEPPPGTPGRWLINVLRTSFHHAYLERYCALRTMKPHDIDGWLAPMAAARLGEDIENEADKLLALIKRSLEQ